MRKLYCLNTLAFSLYMSAQINIQSPNIDAASLFKLTESPVSLNNGLVDIKMPIYEIKTKGINIPIALNYYSRGIRVEDIASNVGLGWSLDYGGMISRQVRDFPDDSTNGYLYTDTYNNFFTDLQKRLSVYNQLLFEPYRDLIPDQFYFSIPNYSGKFIFDQFDQSILLQNFSDIKIQTDLLTSPLNSWVITDTNGNKFYYGKVDNITVASQKQVENFVQKHPLSTYTADPNNANSQYYDSWYLQKIETSFGEIIKYKYTIDQSFYYSKSYDKIISPCVSPCDQPTNTGAFTYFSKINENKYVLESIEFPNGKLKFIMSQSLRQDIINGHSLDKIILYDNNNNIIQSHQLNYQIQNAINSNNKNDLLATLDPSSNKRMFLKEVIKEKNGIVIEKNIYDYKNILLPNRFSTSQDIWGYYNNASNGSFLHFFDYDGQMSSDRTTDLEKSKSGIIETITNSAGGIQRFTFENNVVIPVFDFNKILGKIQVPYD